MTALLLVLSAGLLGMAVGVLSVYSRPELIMTVAEVEAELRELAEEVRKLEAELDTPAGWVEDLEAELRALEGGTTGEDDPDAPLQDMERCASLGHAYVTRTGGWGMTFRSCPRCGAADRVRPAGSEE